MEGPALRSIIGPAGVASPTVAHIPHASTVIPAEVRARLLLGDEALARELVRMTDWHTDTLFAFTGRLGATRLVNGVSRLVVDPERFTDDAQEPMAAVGQGAVYTRTSDGLALRELLDGERDALLDTYFAPYHADLAGLVGDRLAADGRCLLLDCHSFAAQPLASELDQTPDRPDVCIGTDAFHTPAALVDALVDGLAAEGYVVAVDRPFAGTIVPLSAYRLDRRVASVMIEVRRGLYCDEATGEPLRQFDEIGTKLARATASALSREGWVPDAIGDTGRDADAATILSAHPEMDDRLS